MKSWVAGGLAVVLVVVVFVLTSPEEVATDQTVAPLPTPTTTSLPGIGDLEPGEPSVITGALPDGTEYVVTVNPGLVNEWHGSSAGIVIEYEGSAAAVGMVRFQQTSLDDYSFEDGVYRVPAGEHLVEIEFYDHILEHLDQIRYLGQDAETTIINSISGGEAGGLPILEVNAPFRWGLDDELPYTMETRYSTFSVRRGCSRYAAACSEDGKVQVLWRPAELSSAPQWRLPQVTVETLERR